MKTQEEYAREIDEIVRRDKNTGKLWESIITISLSMSLTGIL